MDDRRRQSTARILLVQEASAPRNIRENLRRVQELVALHPSVDIAIFPELFLTGYELGGLHELAVAQSSSVIEELQEICARSEVAFIGGYVERSGDHALPYNSMVLVDAVGRIAGNYRKTHLFAEESAAFQSGGVLECIDVGPFRIGPMICFDMEIPEVARTLAKQKPDFFVTISANMKTFEAEHDIASRGRALENRTPHVYVNRVGREAGWEFVGATRVVDQDGHVVTEFAEGACSAVVELDLERHVAPEVDYLSHLRPHLYGVSSLLPT